MNILVTGPPRSGKTTLIKNIVEELNKKTIGFITEEFLKQGKRVGFKIKTFSGLESMLASIDNKHTSVFVGKYGVFLENLELVLETLEKELKTGSYDLIVVDEIGKMELSSKRFRDFITESLDLGKVFGSIMLYDNAFTKSVKERTDTKVYTLTRGSWVNVKNKILEDLKS
ncbi:MAG: nucleoside-triphosphatase [Candidatus Odinarchaeum yellowstonii]|uniref:Nucleoside-triphosphatase n=1 Tax=Odinarchaeota yellowstonii (strain LCB_4) TaxID=1841599 RepID=A0AAF0IAL7_ODILC|nr:MAG: nucleoside-triphosphatase [Candidatus Odinarchaeum yellowstonii]